LPVLSCKMIELSLLVASWWNPRTLIPGIGVYRYEVRPLVSFAQSVVHLLIAVCFIQVIKVDFRE
jgi:hypothetical protein